MRQSQSKGECRFCHQIFSGRGIGKHLLACRAKKEKDETLTIRKDEGYIYHLKISAWGIYWLHIEMEGTATLLDLDNFLREIWLECCGHLSQFTIHGERYSSYEEQDDFWGDAPKSMDIRLEDVLDLKDKFDHEYDFGSTTELALQVLSIRKGVIDEPIRILARNHPPVFECENCNKIATQICSSCWEDYCDDCIEKHECGEDYMMPLVNSPRTGVCGYFGPLEENQSNPEAYAENHYTNYDKMGKKISEILEAFKIHDGVYKRDQIDAAIEMKEEITPYLIDILHKVLSNPNEYIENENLYDHIYALMLLGHFRESAAHRIIVDLFSLPGDLSHDLFGDLATSDLPTLLLRTCGGSMELIRSLALNTDADDYCRISALHAMAYAVVDGIGSRDEVLSFFATLFTGDETDEDSDFWGLLANIAVDLCPEEIMDTIKHAYEDGFIAQGLIRYEDVEKALEDGQEKCLERLRIDLERHSMDNIHASMSWWACFAEASIAPSLPAALEDDLLPGDYDPSKHKVKKKKAKAKKKKRKQKRKQAKASKIRNRR